MVSKEKTSANYYLFFEYCNGGDLETLLQIRGKLAETEVKYIFKQILDGLLALNKLNIIHRDIKAANILLHFPAKKHVSVNYLRECDLISAGLVIKIADFGFSKFCPPNDLSKTQCGTPLNMAPEILNGKSYNYKIDIWSLGVTMYECLTGHTPFGGKDKEDLRNNVNLGIFKLPRIVKFSENCLDFIAKCL